MIGLPRVEPVLAGFGGSYGAGIILLAPMFVLFSLSPSVYSNWALLFLFTMLAWLIARAVGRLCAWSNTTIVPGFTVAVFLTCIHTLMGAAIFCALLGWSRSVVPALGPALFVGIGTVALALRFGRLVGPAAMVIVVFAATWDSASGVVPPLGSMLAGPWIQAGTFVLAIISAAALLLVLRRPVGRNTTPESRISMQPDGVARTMGFSALWLAVYVLCLRFEPLSHLSVGVGLGYIGFLMDSVTGGFADLHGQLSRNWILPTTRSRAQLARRCTGRLVGRSFAWFPAGVSAAVLQGLVAQQDPLFHILLLLHIAVLLLITFLAGVVRPWPQKTSLAWLVVPPSLPLAFGVVLLALLFEHTLPAYTLLVAAFVASTVFAVFVGGHRLARAEFVE